MRHRLLLVTFASLPALACGTPTDGDGSSTDATPSTTGGPGRTSSTGPSDDSSDDGPAGSSSSTGPVADSGSDGDSSTGQAESTGETGDRDCIAVEVQEWIGLGAGDNAIFALTIPQIGDLGENNDLVQLELYDAPPPLDMPIDLASAPNDNYGTCSQCLRLLEDVVGTTIAKQYFVDRGTLTFTQLGSSGQMAGHFTDVRLIEVTIDGAFNSTPVEDGDCVVIHGQSDFDTIPGG